MRPCSAVRPPPQHCLANNEVVPADGDPGPELEVEQGVGQEARAAKTLASPKQPTQREIDEHNISHLPPRNWCAHCVRGRAVSTPHRSLPDEERRLPTVSMDYYFMGQDEEKALPLLAVRDHWTRRTFTTVVRCKGADEHAVKWLQGVMERCGYKRMLFKCDNANLRRQ